MIDRTLVVDTQRDYNKIVKALVKGKGDADIDPATKTFVLHGERAWKIIMKVLK